MKATREFNWTLRDGKKATCKIEVTRQVVDKIAYADGENINLGKETYKNTTIEIIRDGKVVATGNRIDTNISADAKKAGGYAQVGSAVLLKEVCEKIAALIIEATEEAEKDEEYTEVKNEETEADEKEMAIIRNAKPETRGSGWCNKCKSYCYGDCES